MDTDKKKPKKRRARGSGSVYKIGRIWWCSYYGPDGKRHAESSESERKGDAERMLQRRVGAREHNLPVIPHAERLTFDDATKAVVDDFVANGKRSVLEIERRIRKHLVFFSGRRMAGITKADITAFVAKRQTDVIVTRKARIVTLDDGTEQHLPAVTKPVSQAEINRELAIVKRAFNLAIESGRIAMMPKIKMLREAAPRSGFFEREQYETVLAHLPAPLRSVIEFAFNTGWRINSEVLPLEWRNVDFDGGEVRLAAGTTKNGEGRTFPLTNELRRLLKTQHAEHERLKRAGHIFPLVFFREVVERGEKKPQPIQSFKKAWRVACRAAGCPGRIPHDLRRTAIRNLVRAGIPERVAMMMTGHKTRSIFERYNITSDGDLRGAARTLDAAAMLTVGKQTSSRTNARRSRNR